MSSSVVQTRKGAWTEEELQRLPEDGCLHEVIEGELVMSPKNNFEHGSLCARLMAALATFAFDRKLGVVVDSSTGFWMHNRNCRAPDISFIAKERLKKLGFKRSTRKFFPGAPDLAVEILSPGNTRAEIDARLRDYFSSGTQIAWLIHPDEERVEVCYSLTERNVVPTEGTLDGEKLLPGFRYAVADLFKDWDWE